MDIKKACYSLINEQSSGVLSTLSAKIDGFPFGSIVPFCTDQNGFPVIYISTIAEHTKNIIVDSRVSLFLSTSKEKDTQAAGRVTIVGNAKLITDQDKSSERYFRYFPSAVRYQEMHSFNFYRIVPIKTRFIGGFGAIHWIEKNDTINKNPFWGENEAQITAHMNTDHASDLALYMSFYKKMTTFDQDSILLAGIDADGFDLMLNDSKMRFHFENPVTSISEARAAFVKLSKEAKT